MGHRRGGGRLGGERGGDSGRDLRLQCCGGLGVSHPKRNKKKKLWPGAGEGGWGS